MPTWWARPFSPRRPATAPLQLRERWPLSRRRRDCGPEPWAQLLVTPTTAQTRPLTPSVLASMGRELAIRGESVHVLDLDGGGVTLTPASRWEVSGGTRPESWRYAVEFPLPGGRVVKRTLPGAGVIHLRYATRPGAPWAGVSPLGMASETQALAGWIEKRLAQETSTPTGYVLAVPDGASDGNVTGLAGDAQGPCWQALCHRDDGGRLGTGPDSGTEARL